MTSPPPLRRTPGRSMLNLIVSPRSGTPLPKSPAAPRIRSRNPSLNATVSISSGSAAAGSTWPATSQVCSANSVRRRSSKPRNTSGPAISASTPGSSSVLPKRLAARTQSRLSASRAGPVTSQPASAKSSKSSWDAKSPRASAAARSKLTPNDTVPEPFSATSTSTPTSTSQADAASRAPASVRISSSRRIPAPPAPPTRAPRACLRACRPPEAPAGPCRSRTVSGRPSPRRRKEVRSLRRP